MHLAPNRIEAYQVLADFLVALNRHSEALKILEILTNNDPNGADQILRSQYEQIREKERKKSPNKLVGSGGKAAVAKY